MQVTALVENTSSAPEYGKAHGLSFYIETAQHKLLFDVGPDDTFLKNAARLNIDIAAVDTVILSHGHYDHGGGLSTFVEHNRKARIYLTKTVWRPHYISVPLIKKYIGLDPKLARYADSRRFVYVDNTLQIDNELLLFSGVRQRKHQSESSAALLVKTETGYVQDDFSHEQNLILSSEDATCLFAGCAHSGIVNILETALAHNANIGYVFGGFHLYNPANKRTERPELINAIAAELEQYPLQYHTCHCTGPEAFSLLHQRLGERMRYISTGETVSCPSNHALPEVPEC